MVKKLILILFVLLFAFAVNGLAQELPDEYDFEGATVTFSSSSSEAGSYEDPESAAWLEKVENAFNVNIEFTGGAGFRPPDFVENLAPQVMAGDADADLYHHQHSSNRIMAASEGLIYPLTEYIDFDRHPFQEKERFTHPDGEVYGTPYYTLPGQSLVIFYNKSMFERNGWPDLHDLYQEGEWTWDALLNIAVDATTDTTGDGQIDRWGFSHGVVWCPRMYEEMLPAFLASNDQSLVTKEDGRVVHRLDEPGVIETFEFIRELFYETGAGIDRGVYLDRDLNHGNDEFAQNNVAMIMDYPFRISRFSDEMEDDYSIVPVPKGPRAEEHTYIRNNVHARCIPVSTEHDVEALVELSNALDKITIEYWDQTPEEFKEEVFEEDYLPYLRDEESIEIVEKARFEGKNYYDHNYMITLHQYEDWSIVRTFTMHGEPVVPTLDAVKDKVQAELDDRFN